ncbi:Photosystem I reaction center subunit III [Kovacikia minuta CCNUW1]|uniref:Photosystem I reaction center subunit III n=1 Tax=Kovacikia minuta TaxID=2931930 RepID=UPI001CCE7EAD|nr:Photosystem I reaction center subunit III [Kovacikia minuta]UBF25705.1 Photosystem I reaction center subunit III [Kovacikia minuta CCNUW1]
MRRLFALILAVFLWLNVAPALSANAATLTPCKDSPAFQQRAQTSQSATAPRRFAAYSSLLCGEEGLPHLVVDPTAAHVGEFTIPGILFLYIAGWIGWAGRTYLQAAKKSSNPEEKEIIIDVPLALQSSLSGAFWPLAALKEFTTGELTAKDDEIPISVR